MNDYKFENNKIEFNKKKINWRLNQRNEYFGCMFLVVVGILKLLYINKNFNFTDFLYWFGMLYIVVYIYIIIAGYFKQSINEAIFDDVNIILTMEWKDSEIFISFYNSLSLVEESILIKKEEFAMIHTKIPLTYKIIYNGIDIYFPFSSFDTEYLFKKYFDFKLPIIEIEEPKKKKRFFFF